MYDLHNHILWGIDDGAKDFDETKEICDISADQGINFICATPHFIIQEKELDFDEIKDKLKATNDYCKESNLNIQVFSGCECYINPLVPDYAEQGKILTLNNTRYLLMELPMDNVPAYLNDVIYKLQLKGIVPILAHPERYSFIKKNPKRAIELVEKGVLLQCNTGSFLGLYGESSQKISFSLLRHNLVHLIGTDCHRKRISANGVTMKKCIEVINEFNQESHSYIDIDYLLGNAQKVVEDREIDILDPIPYEYSQNRQKQKHKKNFLTSLLQMFAN